MKPKPTSRIPMLLSAFVCPGAGQLMQRRGFAGSAYLLLFLSAFVYVMVAAGQIIASYYRLGFEFDTYEPEPVSMLNILPAFGIALLIYVANLIDVFVAQQRIFSKKARENFLHQ